MFRAKVVTFMAIVIAFLTTPPLVNWFKNDGPAPISITQKALYNTDFIIKPLQAAMFNYGVRLNPKKVVIGKEKWLFLGDGFAQNVTRRIQGVSQTDRQQIKSSIARLKHWQEQFRAAGVSDFRLLLGPDKASIYPDYLPNWAQAAQPTKTDLLTESLKAQGLEQLVVDPRSTLTRARELHPDDLYMRTDTHWNSLGAWIALNHFIDVSRAHGAPATQWPSREMIKFKLTPWPGGDLARLLRLDLNDVTLVTSFDRQVKTQIRDIVIPAVMLESLPEEPRAKLVAGSRHYRTENALNDRRVLIIRDSFGDALLPFFQRTFSDVTTVPQASYTREILTHLIDSIKPEAIYLVIVERDSIDSHLGLRPIEK